MELNFSLRKHENNVKKVSKKTNEIKCNISSNSLVVNKDISKVIKFDSISNLCNFVTSISPDIQLKLLFNYSTNQFYIYKTCKGTSKELKNTSDNNELNTKEISSFLKSFYSNEQLEWNDIFLKKNKSLLKEIAPLTFDVQQNYLMSEDKVMGVTVFEHIGNESLNDLLLKTDCWISIDCYRLDSKFILDKISSMKEDNVLERKFSDFILTRLDDILKNLKDDIFQCEFKLLLNSTSQYIDKDLSDLKNLLKSKNYFSYTPTEKINIKNLFNKCIYPNSKMDIVHSVSLDSLLKMIGGESYV